MVRRDLWLMGVSVALGPLVTSVVFALLGTVVETFVYESAGEIGLVQHMGIVIFFGYVYGLVPAVIGALVMSAWSRRLPDTGRRWSAAALVGALVTLPIIALFGFAWPSFLVGLAAIPGGALAGLLCIAIVDRLAPLSPPVRSAP